MHLFEQCARTWFCWTFCGTNRQTDRQTHTHRRKIEPIELLVAAKKNKYASTNIAATRVLANTKQKTKSISQYQTNKKRISEREKAELKN